LSTGIEPWLESLQALAEELKSDPSAAAQYDQLQQLLGTWRARRAEVDQDLAIRLSFFLGKLSEKVTSQNVTRLIDQLMQVRPSAKPDARSYEERRQITQRRAAPPTQSPATESPPAAKPPPRPAPDDEVFFDLDYPDTPVTRSAPQADPPQQPVVQTRTDADADEPPQRRAEDKVVEGEPTYPEVERRVNSAYRLHLDRKHGEIEKLQELLAQKATEAMAQNKAFGALLETERAALQQANSVSEIDDMKQILIGGTDELLAGQRDLAEKLHSSFEYLQIIKNDSERLHSELNKVRLLSLTDENTGLPNRRAFLRRLEDEIDRSQRYNMSFTLALIDLDFFKEVNDGYGHPAGDAVLTWYAEHALPIFRHYDMVARYGGEEFAVLFPGTTGEGARRALAKMRNHISGASIEHDGVTIDIPTFSAGLATFKLGDTEAMLIKRADQALYSAKSLGRDRIEREQREIAQGADGSEQ